ncbi:MAG: hypothetical protein SHS37scaffold296_47 [Burkholderiales phage 68_11]|nr:MAG: hypothetical protein SHS37scaffold296_47 [Burkholderiales phage 68_11]
MSKRINIVAGASPNGGVGVGVMTSAGNPWTIADALAYELVNRQVATLVDAEPQSQQAVTLTPTQAAALPGLVSGAGNQTIVADASINLVVGVNSISSAAGGATKLQLAVPATGGGEFRVRNADKKSDTAVYLQHAQPAVRLADSGSSVALPSVTLSATADVGWTVAALVRVHSVNTQAGTTHYAFLKIGTGSAYFLLGYEGANATNPGCLKALMPNAAATGLSSVRSNASPTPAFAAFAPSNLGNWLWVFVRKHGAALVENVLSLSTGLEQSATFADETVTLAWAPVLPASATGTQVYAGSTGIASGAYSAATAALKVGPDASTTGACDVAKVMVLAGACLTQAQMREIAKGFGPQDIGVTVTNGTDVYYDLTTTVAADLLDGLGGTAATSVTLAGSDAATPVANRPSVLQRIGSTGSGWLQGGFADGTGYKDGALA